MTIKEEIQLEEYKRAFVEAYKQGFKDAMSVCMDEPQRDCFLCKWLGEVNVCGRCRNRNLFFYADTEQTERSEQ